MTTSMIAARLVLASCLPALATAASYQFTPIDYPGAALTVVEGLNAKGQVVGYYNFAPANSPAGDRRLRVQRRQVRKSRLPRRALDPRTRYQRLQPHCWIVHGQCRRGPRLLPLHGQYRFLDYPKAKLTGEIGVNNAGAMAGGYVDAADHVHGFVESNGVFKSIDYPGSTWTSVMEINDQNVIAGNYTDAANVDHGFVYTNGKYITIDVPSAVRTEVYGVDDSEQVSGTYRGTDGKDHGFLYQGGVYTTVEVAGAAGTTLLKIAGNAIVTGFYTDSLGELHGLVGEQ